MPPTMLQRDILWSATVGPSTLEQRIEAAAASGYPKLSVSPADHRDLVESGASVSDAVTAAADRGVEFAVIDAIVDWYPYEPPKRPFPGRPVIVDDLLVAAAQMGSTVATALAPYPTTASIDALVESFAALCDRCAEGGVSVQLEFTPFPPVPDLETAWQIITGADRPNAGIMFDCWHWFRGRPDGDLLASIPGERILGVQVSDGGRELTESLVKDTYLHRRLPGDGDFDLAGVLGTLRDIGGLRNAGPEVLSVELAKLGPLEAARLAAERYDELAAVVNR